MHERDRVTRFFVSKALLRGSTTVLLEIRDRTGGGGAGESLSPTPILKIFFIHVTMRDLLKEAAIAII